MDFLNWCYSIVSGEYTFDDFCIWFSKVTTEFLSLLLYPACYLVFSYGLVLCIAGMKESGSKYVRWSILVWLIDTIFLRIVS